MKDLTIETGNSLRDLLARRKELTSTVSSANSAARKALWAIEKDISSELSKRRATAEYHRSKASEEYDRVYTAEFAERDRLSRVLAELEIVMVEQLPIKAGDRIEIRRQMGYGYNKKFINQVLEIDKLTISEPQRYMANYNLAAAGVGVSGTGTVIRKKDGTRGTQSVRFSWTDIIATVKLA